MTKPGEVKYVNLQEQELHCGRMPGYPTVADLIRLAEAIKPFKTERMELLFADAMEMVFHPPILMREK